MTLLEAGGYRLAVNDVGSGSPVLFCHPFLLDSSIFSVQLDALARERRVLTVDFPGHGHSPPPPGPVTFESFAKALREVLAKKQIARVDAVGNSMGGYGLLSLTQQAPLLVGRLVLCGSRVGAMSPEARETRQAMATRVEAQGIGGLPAEWVPLLLKPAAELAQRRQLTRIIQRTTPQGVAAAARALASRPDLSAAARAVTAKTLIIHGGQDRLSSLRDAEDLEQLIDGAQLEVIGSAGHVPSVDEPEHFTRMVLSFLGA